MLSRKKVFLLEILNVTWRDRGGVIGGESSSSTSSIVTVLRRGGGGGGSVTLSSVPVGLADTIYVNNVSRYH